MSETRHFLTLLDFSPAELRQLLERASEMKREHRAGNDQRAFPGTTLGMIFAKSSTRTRVSFEAGMAQLGGHAIFLSPQDSQLGRGEPVEDSARVISSMVDMRAKGISGSIPRRTSLRAGTSVATTVDAASTVATAT